MWGYLAEHNRLTREMKQEWRCAAKWKLSAILYLALISLIPSHGFIWTKRKKSSLESWAAFLIQTRLLRFDYLMPAELFPLGLVGSLLLLWAAFRARSRRGIIGGGLAAALTLLVGTQALAEVTGLASGRIEPTGVWFVLANAGLAGFILALVVIAIGGLSLVRDLSRPAPSGFHSG
jgi:hypothetical protein